jgi:hypothetical protein
VKKLKFWKSQKMFDLGCYLIRKSCAKSEFDLEIWSENNSVIMNVLSKNKLLIFFRLDLDAVNWAIRKLVEHRMK